MTKDDIIRLGEQLSAENNAAHDLWTWLPSYAVTKRHHEDYVDEFQPSVADVMREAAMYLAHLRRIEVPWTVEERDWFERCTCNESHDGVTP